MKKLIWVVLCFCFTLFLRDAVAGGGSVQIREWQVPWKFSRPRDPYVDQNGLVWFVGQLGDYVAYLNPQSGKFKRFELEKETGPHNLIVDKQGKVWYAGNRAAHIGLLDPDKGGVIKKYPMVLRDAHDPHTLVLDKAGDIWFTVQGGNFIGRLEVSSGEMQVLAVPTKRARPYGIVVSGAGDIWFTEFGSHKLGWIDRDSMSIKEVVLPRKGARPRRLAATSDSNIWYVDYRKGYLGKYDVAQEKFSEWQVPGGKNAHPYGMAADDKDRLWFVETDPAPNRLVGFDPKTASFFSITEIPSGGGSIRHMFYDTKRSQIWFGTDTNTIGRINVP